MAEAPAHALLGLPRWYFLLMYGPRAAGLDMLPPCAHHRPLRLLARPASHTREHTPAETKRGFRDRNKRASETDLGYP